MKHYPIHYCIECFYCSLGKKFVRDDNRCYYKKTYNKIIPNIYVLPKFCKLENYKEVNKFWDIIINCKEFPI